MVSRVNPDRRSSPDSRGRSPNDPDDVAVAVEGLVKTYNGRNVVDGVSFRARSGSITAVLGPNGAGKTTTIECCEGLRRPDSGQVRVLGRDPAEGNADLRARVGVMLQDGGLPNGAQAGEVIRHVAAMHHDPIPPNALLEAVGLSEQAKIRVRRLSGGQRQRLAVAAAVVGRPELVFLDEPSAGLDPHGRLALWAVIRTLRASGTAVLLTTHSMEEAERLADQIIVVHHGKVVAEGTPDELTESSSHELLFSAPPDLDLRNLGPLLPPGTTVVQRRAGSYLVSGTDSEPLDPMVIVTITAWCTRIGVTPRGLQLGRRSLEDVYLDLTGRNPR